MQRNDRTMRCTQVADRPFPDGQFFGRDWVIAGVRLLKTCASMAAERMIAEMQRVSISTCETEIAGILSALGAVCLAVGIASATGQDKPLLWLLAGGAFALIAAGIWWWSLKVEISQHGVVFLPQVIHGKFNFFWSDVQGWCWRSHSYTDCDGDVQVDRMLIVLFTNGQELALPYPYCCKELVDALSNRIGGEAV